MTRYALQTQKEIRIRVRYVKYYEVTLVMTEDRKELVGFVKSKFGRCDLLVNNAGTAPLKRLDILEATEESF